MQIDVVVYFKNLYLPYLFHVSFLQSLVVAKEQLPSIESNPWPHSSKEHACNSESTSNVSSHPKRRVRGNLPVPVRKKHQFRQQPMRTKWWKRRGGEEETLEEEEEEEDEDNSTSSEVEEDESDEEDEQSLGKC